MRVKHEKYGPGVILEEFISYGGQLVARVVFDANPENERTMLRSCVTDSDAKLPEAAKKPKARKPRAKKSKPEPVNDSLLCPQLDEAARLAPDFGSDYDAISVEAE